MAVKDRRFSLGVLTLAFILGFFVMTQSVQIVDEMDYSETGIPLWKGSWRDVPERYRVHLRLRGTLAMEEFPVPHFGPAPITPSVPPPIWMDVGVLEVLNTGYERTPKKVFFWAGKRTNMVLEYDGLLRIGGVPLYAWNEAFSERHIIEVEGYAFDVIQEGKRYTLFHVEALLPSGKDGAYITKEEAISSGRLFLEDEGFNVGRVMSVRLNLILPNFQWNYKLKFNRPDLVGLRACWLVRFERAGEPGHYVEVWIDALEHLIIGGTSCK